jgi:RNA polymerase sigma-70 factor (ECF subfamily)
VTESSRPSPWNRVTRAGVPARLRFLELFVPPDRISSNVVETGIRMTLDPSLQSVADDDLVPRIARGDAAAFAELFRRRRKDVYGFALHMTGAPAVAEDVAQDVFVTVMREAARYQPGRARAVSWLCGIARNVARQRLDRERPFLPLAHDDAQADGIVPTVHPDPVGDLTRAEGIERVRRAVLTLPLHYREAIVLCELQELTYAEAAGAIGCGIGTVRSRVHRGRELLAAKLGASRAEVRPLKVAGGRCFA